MAAVRIENGSLKIQLSWVDRLLGFQGSFEMPLSHVINAYVSSYEDLQLQYKIEGVNWGMDKSLGIFANPQGLIFVDVTGDRDCLVVQTRGERFERIAVQLAGDQDANAIAHEIMRSIPDSGPVD
ncbi:MAG TPA: hypothetical protein VGZ02_02895 [Candidatus Baltobacteraceae bacterium]|nr:hypothetical protein [Candidatus Baltobacteraceae bacterium]